MTTTECKHEYGLFQLSHELATRTVDLTTICPICGHQVEEQFVTERMPGMVWSFSAVTRRICTKHGRLGVCPCLDCEYPTCGTCYVEAEREFEERIYGG